LPIHSSSSSGGGSGSGDGSVKAWQREQLGRVPARASPQQRGCVGRHLAKRNEMRFSGSDSYALLFLLYSTGARLPRRTVLDRELAS